MTTANWVLIIYFALNAWGSVLIIGKPRPTFTPGHAAVALVMYACLIALAAHA